MFSRVPSLARPPPPSLVQAAPEEQEEEGNAEQVEEEELPEDIPGQPTLDEVQWDFSTSDSLDDGLADNDSDFFYYTNDPMFMDDLEDAKRDGDIPITVADTLDTDQELSAAGCAHARLTPRQSGRVAVPMGFNKLHHATAQMNHMLTPSGGSPSAFNRGSPIERTLY